MIFVSLSISVWLYNSDIIIFTIASLTLETPTTSETIRLSDTIESIGRVFNRQYYAPIFTLVLIGWDKIFKLETNRDTKVEIFAILGLIAFFVGGPSPLNLVSKLLNSFSFARWSQYLFLFMLTLAAVGLYSLVQSDNKYVQGYGKFIVALLLTISISGTMVAPDNPMFETKQSSGYFHESEVTAFDHIIEIHQGEVYVDQATYKYYPLETTTKRISPLKYNRYLERMIFPNDGMSLYRSDHANSRSILIKTGERRVRFSPEYEGQYVRNRSQIYSSGTVIGIR
jgi:hypothetical protein